MTAARTLTDSDMIVTLTRGELREIVTAAVREALEAKADETRDDRMSAIRAKVLRKLAR